MIEMLAFVGVPLVRGVAGWLEKAARDGVIDVPEWKKLVETVLRIGVPQATLFYGFALPVGYALALPVMLDYAYHYVNKVLKKFNN